MKNPSKKPLKISITDPDMLAEIASKSANGGGLLMLALRVPAAGDPSVPGLCLDALVMSVPSVVESNINVTAVFEQMMADVSRPLPFDELFKGGSERRRRAAKAYVRTQISVLLHLAISPEGSINLEVLWAMIRSRAIKDGLLHDAKPVGKAH